MAETDATGSLTREEQTDIATSHGNQAESLMNIYSGIAGVSTTNSTTSQSDWNATNSATDIVQETTAYVATIDNSDLKARQLTTTEASLVDKTREAISNNAVLTDEGKAAAVERLEQLACAEVKCAAGVSENDPLYPQLKDLQNAGEALIANGADIYDTMHSLGVDTPTKSNGRMGTRSETTFSYSSVTAIQDTVASNEETTAAVESGAQIVAGTAGIVASTGLCSTGIGCLGGAVLGTASAASVADGVNSLNSEYEYQNGQRVVDSFSTTTSQGDYNPIVDATLGIVPNLLVAGTAVRAANSATNSLSLVDDIVNYGNRSISPTWLNTVNGGVSGATGGLVSSGDTIQEQIVGTGAGFISGIVGGAAIKNTSTVITVLVGSGTSTLGQLTGSAVNSFIDNDLQTIDTSEVEFDWRVSAAAGFGALIGNRVGGSISGRTAGSVIGSRVGIPVPPTSAGSMAGAVIEGTLIGSSELIANEVISP